MSDKVNTAKPVNPVEHLTGKQVKCVKEATSHIIYYLRNAFILKYL